MEQLHQCNSHKDTPEYKKIKNMFYQDFKQYSKKDLDLLYSFYNVENHNQLVAKIIQIHCNNLEFLFDNKKCLSLNIKYDSEKRNQWIEEIYIRYKPVIQNNYLNVTPELLQSMLFDYDDLFFNKTIQTSIDKNELSLDILVNGKHTFNTEGYCISNNCHYTITIPVKLLKRYKRKSHIAGILTNDLTECVQRALEHEMVHLLIFLYCKNSDLTDYHGNLFSNMVHSIFGHQTIYHEII